MNKSKVDNVYLTQKFKDGVKQLRKDHRTKELEKLNEIIKELETFSVGKKYKNHSLGNHTFDLHVTGDIVLLYRYLEDEMLILSLELSDLVNHKELNREYNIIKKDKNVRSTIKLDGEVKSLDDLIKDESLKEAPYGGAYDIANDQYFTRDDINEFAYELEEALDDEFHDVEYVSAYIENGEIEVTLRFRDYEETVTKKIDMRKIKSPKDLTNKYIDVFYNEFFELFEDDRELDNRSTLERGFYD